MDVQLIIVILVGVFVGIILLHKMWKFFFGKKEEHKCIGCGGCAMGKREELG